MKSHGQSEQESLPDQKPVGKKKAYQPPRLTDHGDLRRLTQAKKGTKGDGGGPSTRV